MEDALEQIIEFLAINDMTYAAKEVRTDYGKIFDIHFSILIYDFPYSQKRQTQEVRSPP